MFRAGQSPAPTHVYRTCALSLPCHCETSPQTGRGNPSPAPAGAELQSLPCVKAAQCAHWVVRRSVAEVARSAGGIVVPRPASLCEGGVKTFGFDGRRDDFRRHFRKTIRRGGALPLPPFLRYVPAGAEPRPYAVIASQCSHWRGNPLLVPTPRGCFQRGRARTPSLFGRFKGKRFLRKGGNRNPPFLKPFFGYFLSGKKVSRRRQKGRQRKSTPPKAKRRQKENAPLRASQKRKGGTSKLLLFKLFHENSR